jgi:hypothetical protein
VIDILYGTPKWVFAALFMTLYYGISACFDSRENIRTLVTTPFVFLCIATYFLVFRSASTALAAMVFASTLMIGASLGLLVYRDVAVECKPTSTTAIIPGEYKLLSILTVAFALKYLLGYWQAIDPQLSHNPVHIAADVGISGAVIGFLLGRCLTFARKLNRLRMDGAKQ